MVDDKLWVLAHSHHPGEKQHGRIMLLVFSWPGAVLSVGPTRLRLVRAGVVDAPLEKNWIPFVDDMGQVRVSYQIEPHIVLTCGSPSGACVILYNTSAASLWHRRCSDRIAKRLLDHHPVNPSMVRGGTTCVTGVVPGEHVCIGHWHNNYASYYHWFYSFILVQQSLASLNFARVLPVSICATLPRWGREGGREQGPSSICGWLSPKERNNADDHLRHWRLRRRRDGGASQRCN